MRRILTLAARRADIVTIAPGPIGRSADPNLEAALAERISWVSDSADAAGRSPERHLLLSGVVVCDNRKAGARSYCAEIASRLPSNTTTDLDEDAVLRSPFIAIGSKRQICDQLRELRATHGVSYLSVMQTSAKEFVPVLEELVGT